MDKEKQRIAIAEACGITNRWVLMKRGYYYRPKANGYTSNVAEAWIVDEITANKHVYPHDEPVTKHPAPVPDYLSDLNAMHEAEKVLFERYGDEGRRIFGAYLVAISNNLLGKAFNTSDWHYWRSQHATATQRAEAFLRTIGKWEEST